VYNSLTMSQETSKTRSIRFPEDLKEAIELAAARNDRTFNAEVIRSLRILYSVYKRHNEPTNPEPKE